MKRGDQLLLAFPEYGANIADGDPVRQDGCAVRVLGGLFVVMSWGGGWDHVSVSRKERTPTWTEMEYVRKMVSLPGEVWLQYGVPVEKHINFHPYCLHWWRPQDGSVPTPPEWMV